MGAARIKNTRYECLVTGEQGGSGSLGYATRFTTDGWTVKIFHHASCIAELYPSLDLKEVIVETDDRGYGTVTTTNRIRQVLRDNGIKGVECRVQGGETVYTRGGEEVVRSARFVARRPNTLLKEWEYEA